MGAKDGTPDADALAAIEERLWALLEPFRGRLEEASVYGMPTLRRPGTGAHGFFAGVRAGERNVSFHLKPLYDHPDLLETIPPALRRRLSGKQAFSFTALDADLESELAALLALAFGLYETDRPAGS
jgi:hypothetical protein